ncbi:MAG: hypothetical protein GEU80_00945 [Dehalococcoidia bacterium]|nr:hypothetical protein [Dehalococcoidia bacterium]
MTEELSFAGDIVDARQDHAAVRLADGRVLVTGGAQDVHHDLPLVESAEIYDPATRSFVATGSMLQYRFGHDLTLLPDGSVLVTGIVSTDALLAERYTP